MKRKTIYIFLLILLLFISNIGYADDHKVYSIDFVPMAVVLPDNYIVLTRNTDKDDPALKTLKLDYEDVKETFELKDIYLIAFPQDIDTFISISVFENNSFVPDLSKLSDDTIKSLYEASISEYIEKGASVSDFEIIRNSDIIYIKYYFQAPSMSYFQFTTFYNKRSIQITAQVYSQEEKNQINQIITDIINNNIFFGDTAYSLNNTYTEPITGTVFHLRKGLKVY